MEKDMQLMISDTHKVYAALSDNLSKYFFRQRLMYALTQDYSVLQEMYHTVFKCLIPNDKKIVAFGGGEFVYLIRYYKSVFGLKIETVIDNSPKPNLLGIEVLNAVDLLREISENGTLVEYAFLINVSIAQPFIGEMKEQLLRSGVSECDIFHVSDLFHTVVNPDMSPLIGSAPQRSEQYFDVDLGFSDDEVFVDVGVWNGFTSISFANNMGGRDKYRKIYAFEPDKQSFMRSDARMKAAGLKYELVNKGLWSKSDRLIFSSHPRGNSRISSAGDISLDVTTLDEYFSDKDDKPTFIKMDIEGAELGALIGMEKTIRRYKPKLAICVYHKPEDLLTIPQLCLNYNPNYKVFMRKYLPRLDDEFVMYFV